MNYLSRSIFVGIIVTSLLFVSGCGGSDHVEDHFDTQTFQGELSELSSFISGLDVTHVLVTGAKERVFLRSLLFELKDYENKEVRVTGTYTQEEVSEKPVNVLTVDKIDILSDVKLFGTELDEIYASDDLGIRFSYPSLLFDVSEASGRIAMNAVDGDATVILRKFKTSIELDSSVYISSNYDSFDFDEAKIGSGLIDSLTNASASPDKVVYILKRSGHFYELSFTDFSNGADSKYDQVFDEMLATYEFTSIAETDDELNSEQEAEEEIEDDMEGNESEDSVSDDLGDDVVQTSTGSSKDPVINAFYVVDDEFLDNVDGYVSFAFTDNNYFYVIFNKSDVQKRALFSYTDDNRFTKIAEFKKGSVQDWDLVSGNNVAYDRPLTLVSVSEEGSTEIALEQGYRYFESLPLGFGIQYPMDWYYARTDDKYDFSNKPIGESAVLVSAESLDEDFSSVSGTKINDRVKQVSSTIYYVELEDSILKVSGASINENELRIMATSVSVVKKSD